ncbi:MULTISPECIES: hypothetical protein [Nocardia]|jgi:antibiotic biosynthesis monooxygenase (ABM) superfamily enzyme|uniref:hypothetical protein n=1 Tax=Nocardia abscessus TaxID=120957 RepID=UPI001893E837|nr:hypothetical protein [Nocardia abscessus]MBF6471128.1 hypothetical protein [Nocardia abscessus]
MLDTKELTASGASAAHGAPQGRLDDATSNADVHPAKWKFWLLTMAGLYPLLTALVTITAPVLEPLPTPLRLACIIPVAVAAMVWVVTPFLSRCFAGWLAR